MKANSVSYDKQNENKTGDSHEHILLLITDRIKASPTEVRRFKEKFRRLKQDRVAVDYTSKLFSIEDCLECKSKADGLVSTVKRYFKSEIA